MKKIIAVFVMVGICSAIVFATDSAEATKCYASGGGKNKKVHCK